MSRFLRVASNGQTILAVLSMREADARLNVRPGEFLYAIPPESDDGQVINDAVVTVGPGGVLVGAGAPGGVVVERVSS